MSVTASEWAWRVQDLNASQKLLLLALADHAGLDSAACYPSVRKLCERTGLSDRTVRGGVRDLETRGLLTVEHRRRDYGDGGDTSNLYYLAVGAESSTPPAGIAAPPTQKPQSPPAGIADHEPSLEPSVEPKTPPDGFEAFWDAYGLKMDKPTALRAWAKALKVASVEQIMFGLEAYHAWRRALGDRAPLQKYPATWLNAQAWQNDYSRVRSEIPKPKRPAPPKPSESPDYIDDGLVAVSPWA